MPNHVLVRFARIDQPGSILPCRSFANAAAENRGPDSSAERLFLRTISSQLLDRFCGFAIAIGSERMVSVCMELWLTGATSRATGTASSRS